MAISYVFYVKEKIDVNTCIEKFFQEKDLLHKKVSNDQKLTNIDVHEIYGLYIDVLEKEKQYIEYEINNSSNFYEWEQCTNFSITIDKFFDYEIAVSNMLKFVTFILKQSSSDAILLYNNEITLLEKRSGIVKINDVRDFWQNHKFLKQIEEVLI